MSFTKITYCRYAVISETFSDGKLITHNIITETDDQEEARAAAERERRKPVKSVTELPHVTILDRLSGGMA